MTQHPRETPSNLDDLQDLLSHQRDTAEELGSAADDAQAQYEQNHPSYPGLSDLRRWVKETLVALGVYENPHEDEPEWLHLEERSEAAWLVEWRTRQDESRLSKIIQETAAIRERTAVRQAALAAMQHEGEVVYG